MVKLAGRFNLRAVLVAGVLAGLSLVAFEILATALLTGVGTAGEPLRLSAAMVLGPSALDPHYALLLAETTGLVLDLVMAMALALVFAAIVSPIPAATQGELLAGTPGLLLAGVIFGTVVWLVDFYVVGRLAGWTWLTERMNHDVAFFGYAFFFGGLLGWLLARVSAPYHRSE